MLIWSILLWWFCPPATVFQDREMFPPPGLLLWMGPLSYSVLATVTKYKLGDLNSNPLVCHSSRGWKSWTSASTVGFLVRALFLIYKWLLSFWIISGHTERALVFSSPYKDTNPIIGALPSWTHLINYLPNVPSLNITLLGIKDLTYEFWVGTYI